ncbi:MAG TPA: alternative oxidase [Mycobacteriales bacterium]|nr:alternative oxidase [Mycobacteriales bacterium]
MTALLDHSTIAASVPAPRLAGDASMHDDLPKLSHRQLRAEQQRTLDTPRRRYSIAARVLFLGMDLLYGRKRTMSKFRVLEIVARVPYQTWETVTYKQISKRHRHPLDIRRLSDRIREFRLQQDNEQWHLMILDELVARSRGRESRIWYDVLPRLIAVGYWHFAWLLYALKPAWSHRLNADFEDHAEHEYALLVAEHPEWESTPYRSDVCADYGRFASLADLFRQIGHDERLHKQESEQHLA